MRMPKITEVSDVKPRRLDLSAIQDVQFIYVSNEVGTTQKIDSHKNDISESFEFKINKTFKNIQWLEIDNHTRI